MERAILDDLSPTFRAREVAAAGGTLRVLEGGSGPPLVLIHGRGSAATIWSPLLPELAREHRVYAVDLPGFGDSRGYHFGGVTADEGIGFFVDPIDAWLEAEGLAAPALVGHSLGGWVAFELALRRRVTPRRLVLIGSMGLGPELTLGARLFFRAGPERVARALGPALFARMMPAKDPRLGALSYELYTASEGRAAAVAAFDTLVPLLGPAPNRRDRLREITVPTLLLFGEHDEVVPAPLAIAAAGAMPKGEVRIEPGGHSLHLDEPARVRSILRDFLAR